MNFDLLFIKALVVNQNSVGYYTAARAISTIVFGVSIALSSTLLPSISKSYSKGDLKQTKSYISNSIRYLTMILLPSGIIISLTSNKILSFFFPRGYTEASVALSILIFGIIFITIFVVLGAIINGAGKPKLSMSIGLLLLLSNIIFNYYFVKMYGINGGAITILLVGIIGTCMFSIIVFKIFKTLITIKSLIRIGFAGTILIPSFYVLKNIFYDIHILDFIFISIILLGIYLILLYITKEVNKSEIRYIKNILLKKN